MTTAHYTSPFSVHYSVLKPTLHTVIKILDLQPSPHTFSVIDKALLKRSVHSSFLTFRSLFPAPKENVFVKQDEQWRACSAIAMARKRRAKLNVFVTPDEQWRTCSAIAMAKNRQQSQRRGHPHLIQQIAGTVTMRRPHSVKHLQNWTTKQHLQHKKQQEQRDKRRKKRPTFGRF